MWDLIVSVPDHCLSFYFSKPKRARVFNFTQDTHFDNLDSPVKCPYAILYGSRIMAMFAN